MRLPKFSFRSFDRRGMTLVEIMIVLAIIGSIMALLLPRIAGSQDKANARQAKIQIGQLSQALTMYYSDCGKYPQSLEGLLTQDASCTNWGPEPYYKPPGGSKEILDPWGNAYTYNLEGGQFVIKSLGKDGADGGSGNGADISSEDI